MLAWVNVVLTAICVVSTIALVVKTVREW